MKISLKTEQFKQLLAKAYQGVSNNKLAPITSLMGMTFTSTGFAVRTFDGENYLVIKDPSITIEGEDVEVTVNANILKQLVDRITTPDIVLEIKEDRYLLISANGVYKIEIIYDDSKVLKIDAAENSLDHLPTEKIKKKDLVDALLFNEAAAAKTTEVLFEMGVYFGDKVVTTDEILATVSNINLLPNKQFLFKLSSLHLVNVFDKDELSFLCDDKSFILKDDNHIIKGSFLREIEKYPVKEVLQWLDTDTKEFVTVYVKDLMEALDRLSIFVTAYDNDKIVLSFSGGQLNISSSLSTATEHLVVAVEDGGSPNIEIPVSLNSLKVQLEAAKDEKVKLYYNTDKSLRMSSSRAEYLLASMAE